MNYPIATPNNNIAPLTIGALGVVFGDIGTSPLYTMKTALEWAGGNTTPAVALGMLSLIVWTLILTTSVKYVAVVMRADNEGEGGILALMSLLGIKHGKNIGIIAIGLLGAALLYGDGAITPAISVLSALEGLELPFPKIAPFIVLLSVIILLAVFSLQPLGSARIGKLFGPIMVIWFLTIGVLGIGGVLRHPEVFKALNPSYGLSYLSTHGMSGFLVLGAVFLCATGAEALYADMGHFGARPIRIAWYGLVLPMLVLNYAGQTAMVVSGTAGAGDSPFFLLCPAWLQVPLVVLATMATIIASQAIISGAFSMTRQAIQLGLCPRLYITQTSAEGYGQIYVGFVNWILMALTLILTVTFRSSESLAAAFGIAVSLTMLLTSILMFRAMRNIWQWNLLQSLALSGLFVCVDLVFVAANLMKVFEGGWVPLILAAVVFFLMWTWWTGRAALQVKLEKETTQPLMNFIKQMHGKSRISGTAVYLTRQLDVVPGALLHNLKHNKVLHMRIVLLRVDTEHIPRVLPGNRIEIHHLDDNFYTIVLRYGFMEQPDIPRALESYTKEEFNFKILDTSFFVGKLSIVPVKQSRWHSFKVKLFAIMHRNAFPSTEFFAIPPNRVIELGGQIEI